MPFLITLYIYIYIYIYSIHYIYLYNTPESLLSAAQEQFYLETNVALVVPGENDEYTVSHNIYIIYNIIYIICIHIRAQRRQDDPHLIHCLQGYVFMYNSPNRAQSRKTSKPIHYIILYYIILYYI